MKWFSTLMLALCLMGSGCATVTTGDAGIPLSPSGDATPERAASLVVRSRWITSVSNPHLPVFELSFENHSNAWQKITAVRIYAASPAESGPVLIAPNEALPDWRAAVLNQKKVRDHNRDTAIELGTTGALVVGEVLSESDDREVSIAGSVIKLVAASAYTANHYDDRRDTAEALPLLDSNHISARPIAVAPLTTAKRWVLLYTPERANTRGLALVVCYDLAGGDTERVLLGWKAPNRPGRRSMR